MQSLFYHNRLSIIILDVFLFFVKQPLCFLFCVCYTVTFIGTARDIMPPGLLYGTTLLFLFRVIIRSLWQHIYHFLFSSFSCVSIISNRSDSEVLLFFVTLNFLVISYFLRLLSLLVDNLLLKQCC